jgi:hypothetical protein
MIGLGVLLPWLNHTPHINLNEIQLIKLLLYEIKHFIYL